MVECNTRIISTIHFYAWAAGQADGTAGRPREKAVSVILTSARSVKRLQALLAIRGPHKEPSKVSGAHYKGTQKFVFGVSLLKLLNLLELCTFCFASESAVRSLSSCILKKKWKFIHSKGLLRLTVCNEREATIIKTYNAPKLRQGCRWHWQLLSAQACSSNQRASPAVRIITTVACELPIKNEDPSR